VAPPVFVQRAVARARATERSRWWTTFVLTALTCCLWALATPLFAAPDEPAHSIRAASVARLQVVGDEVPRFDNQLVVDSPKAYYTAAGTITCYVFKRSIPADCSEFTDETQLVRTPTSAGRHPPAYYFVAGLPSLAFRGDVGVYLMRMVSALIVAAFVASSATTLERLRRPRVGALGVLLAATPMMFYVGGIVNPSAPEIAAALSLWVAGTLLVMEAPTRVDPRLVRRVAVAGIVLVLSRQLAPLWLALIALALVALGGWGAVRALWASRLARRWGAGVLVAGVLQMIWIVLAGPLDPELGEATGIAGLGRGTAFRISFGETLHRLQEMVGWFGWLDTPSPGFTYIVWVAALAALAALAIVVGQRRFVIVAALTAVVAVAAPIGFETLQARRIGFFWQGRYSMPMAIGVPVLLALSAALSRRAGDAKAEGAPAQEADAADEATGRWAGRLVAPVAIALLAANVVAFGQALRRNTVGYDGPLDFLIDPDWSPPLPAWLLMLGYVAVAGGFVAWIATTPRAGDPDDDQERAREPTPSGSLRYS
jgi:hypothetical protein